MRVAVLLGVLLGCSRPADRVFIYPDLATADGASVPDLAGGTADLLPPPLPDIGRAVDSLTRPDLAPTGGDLAVPPDLAPPCGNDGQRCCQAAFPYCNDAALKCAAVTNTCVSCGLGGMPCCGGDPTTHVGGTCLPGWSCLDATHALEGHCY